MNSKILVISLSVTCMFALPQVAVSYEVKTHREISEQAVENTTLRTDRTLREALGLKSELFSPNDPRRVENETFPNSQTASRDIFGLISDGSAFEDDNPRALAHFYNPINGQPISALGLPSPDWALEDRGPRSLLLVYEQNDSFVDTRDFFLQALTAQTLQERNAKWGRTFQGLGQVIHHLQDMAPGATGDLFARAGTTHSS